MQRPQGEIITIENIVITEELDRRNSRAANLLKENQALQALARQLVNQPQTMLQSLVDIALELCSAGTAGVSLLEVTANGEEIFRWNVLAGALAKYVGGTTPRDFSPCGVCLERGTPQLYSYPERYFTYLQAANTPIVEGLVLPLIADNHALGTIWIMSHCEQRHFDSEDVRVMTSLADLAAAALLLNQRQTQELLAKNAQLEVEAAERQRAEKLAQESEAYLWAMIENLPGGAAFVVDRNLRYLIAGGEALHTAGFKTEDFVGRGIFEVLPPELAANYEPRYRKALAGEPFEHEHQAHNRSYISRGTPLRAENGEIYAVLVVSYDITDRKRTEDERKQVESALRESEAFRRLAVESGRMGTWQWDCRSRQCWGDAGFLSLWAVPPSDEKLPVSVFTSRMSPEGAAALEAFMTTDIAPGEEFDWQLEVVAGANAGRWIWWRGQAERETPWIINGVSFDVTEQKRAEVALRESQARLQSIANLVPDLLWDSEPGGSTNWYNQRWMEYTGQTFEQAIGWGWTDAIHPDDREGSTRRYREAVEQGMLLLQEHRIRRHDGAYRWFVLKASPLKDESGKVIKMYGAATDIHEQWVALEALRESEEKYRSLFNSLDEAFAVVEVMTGEDGEWNDFLFLEVNPAFVKQTGMEYPVGRKATELLGTPNPQWAKVYGRVAETGEPIRFEEGEATLGRVFDLYVFRLGGEGSRRVAVLFTDITDRKRAEEQLRRAAEMDALRVKLSDALRSLSDAVEIQATVTRTTMNFFGADRCYYCEIIDGSAIIRRDASQADLPSVVGAYPLENFPIFKTTIDAGQPFVVQDTHTTNLLDENLRQTCLQLQIISFINVPAIKQGEPVGILCITQGTPRNWTAFEMDLAEEIADRTWATIERTRAEAALREAELQRVREQSARKQERQRAESLAELDRAKTLFFSNVSHEFRTPLTLILAPVQDALSDWVNPLPEVQRERLKLVHRNTLRLLKLVNTLLDFSRIEAGRMEAVYEPTELAMYTTELASVFRSPIEQAGLRLVVDCPPLAESVYVDRQMWEKIVLNLLSNAFKFTFDGEIAVRLHLADDHHVTLQVQDTGTGIEPEQLPYIMKRFYQVRAAKARTDEGSGIGLALVHELIKLHGGTMDVTSTPGVGSCFTVTIPLGTAHLPSDRSQATHTLASTALGATPYVQQAERWIPEEGEREKVSQRGLGGSPHERLALASALATKERHPEGGKGEKDCPPSPLPLTFSPSHILIVDDNADMRDYLTRILSKYVEVQAVADGVAALAAVNKRSPDLVLSDVMMPELDGFGLLKALRADARTKEIPIILLSARAGEESIVEGLLAGADDYLIKPFSANELVTRVNAYLQMANMRSQALQQERTINRRKDEVLSTVSHELNTPLVAILGWTRLLQSNPPSPAMLAKALETIERNATLQAKLVEDLLDISRIAAGKICLNQEPVQLQGVIETAIATVQQSLQTKNIHLDCQLAISPLIVQGDFERLQQIILNLLTNAIKFTPNDGRVEVNLESNENQALIVISDTGCGIDSEFLPYIFDTFRQAPSTKKGLGLGLAIACSLVELHGGTIAAHSPGIGQGTTFSVKLPLI
ncbi:histidine kinase [Nostoc sp. DSM 114161]|jgi:PAS domain S-box-containing protein|uniref:ATP-binding protein n=1 Tax=Nostoc sp. DSM 114161 TaxID=3440143 RepID=UPI0040460E22